jgi:hypothetical protein
MVSIRLEQLHSELSSRLAESEHKLTWRRSEWFMGVGLDLNVILYNNGFYFTKIAALRGYHNANMIALDLWENVYLDSLHIALTDTFSSEG